MAEEGSPQPTKAPPAAQEPPPLPELTAAQYVILAESQRKKRALAEARLKYNALVDENKRMLQEREEAEKTAFEVTESMRRDIHTKNEKIVSLENSLEAQQTRYETDLLALRQKLADNTRDNQMEMQHMEANFQDQIESLTQKHKDVEKYVREKDELERDRLRMHAENDALQNKLEESEREQENRYIQGTMNLKKEYEQKMEELRKRFEEDMGHRLDVSVKRIVQQNKRTSAELQLHVDESTLLQAENKSLQEERKSLMQELSLKVQMEKNYVNRNAKQARELKDSNEKIHALERTLQGFVEDFEKERAFMRQQWERASAEMQSEVSGYKKLVELRTREAKNIRRLAQEVLLQRSDTEIFFLSSLDLVRKEIEHEREAAAPSRTPPTRSGRVDIAHLTWPERERVLRLAFAKINNQTRSLKFLNLPAHPKVSQRPLEALPDPRKDQPLSGIVSGAGKPQLV